MQPGQTLLDVVDTGDMWIAANYKETQLNHIEPGSEVEITVDAVPDVKFKGEVQSIGRYNRGLRLYLLYIRAAQMEIQDHDRDQVRPRGGLFRLFLFPYIGVR